MCDVATRSRSGVVRFRFAMGFAVMVSFGLGIYYEYTHVWFLVETADTRLGHALALQRGAGPSALLRRFTMHDDS